MKTTITHIILAKSGVKSSDLTQSTGKGTGGSSLIALGILLILSWQVLRAQSSTLEKSAVNEESVEAEEADVDAVNTPLQFMMTNGAFETAGRILLYSTPNGAIQTSLNEDQAEKSGLRAAAGEYVLHSNYPNPFNPTTTIRFDLPASSIVTLKVYNVLGQEVATVIDGQIMDDGGHEVEFSVSGGNLNALASGVYFYRLLTEPTVVEDGELVGQAFTSVKKMLMIK